MSRTRTRLNICERIEQGLCLRVRLYGALTDVDAGQSTAPGRTAQIATRSRRARFRATSSHGTGSAAPDAGSRDTRAPDARHRPLADLVIPSLREETPPMRRDGVVFNQMSVNVGDRS